MKTFEEFAVRTVRGPSINLFFEQQMYSLFRELEKVVQLFNAAGVPYEIIGGLAVNAHLLDKERSRSFITRDVDVLIRRADLDEIVRSAVTLGYEARKIVGGFMLRLPHQETAEAVHLIFAGERSKTTQPQPHPDVEPELRDFFGLSVPVIRVRDLVQMKLNSFRAKDLVHLEILDEAGLITPVIEGDLAPVLRDRLAQARLQFAEEKPDQD